MYGAVHEGGGARDFEEAIEWLVSAGMLNRVYNVFKMEHPLTINLHHLSKSILPINTRNTCFVSQSAVIGRTVISPIYRFISPQKQKNCCNTRAVCGVIRGQNHKLKSYKLASYSQFT